MAAAVAMVAAGVVAAATGQGLEPSAGGGEDCLTLGWKLCPPRVFTMAGLEKEKRGRGWEEERFLKGFWNEREIRRGGGGGGGVLDRWFRATEEVKPN